MTTQPAAGDTSQHDAAPVLVGDEVRRALDMARTEGAAYERERWITVISEHYLMAVICDEVNHRDNPVCGCSRVFLGWHPTIGAARAAWVRHVTDVVSGVISPAGTSWAEWDAAEDARAHAGRPAAVAGRDAGGEPR